MSLLSTTSSRSRLHVSPDVSLLLGAILWINVCYKYLIVLRQSVLALIRDPEWYPYVLDSLFSIPSVGSRSSSFIASVLTRPRNYASYANGGPRQPAMEGEICPIKMTMRAGVILEICMIHNCKPTTRATSGTWNCLRESTFCGFPCAFGVSGVFRSCQTIAPELWESSFFSNDLHYGDTRAIRRALSGTGDPPLTTR